MTHRHPQEIEIVEPLVVEQDDGSMKYTWLPNKTYVALYGEAMDLGEDHMMALQVQLDRQLEQS